MAGDIKFLLWLLVLSSSSLCFGSRLDVQCLHGVLRSVVDPKGILEASWVFSGLGSDVCRFVGVECWQDQNRVLALRLRNMGLGDQFPRGLEDCNSMTGLDLSGNNFSGPIPSDVSQQVPFLESLDLSYNSFSGEIPVDITNMAYLNTLNLQGNQLRGQIPGQLRKFWASSFTGNPELCGAPLGDCPSKRKWRLPRINDASSIGAAAGFVVGFVVALYFPRLFVCSRRLRPYFLLFHV